MFVSQGTLLPAVSSRKQCALGNRGVSRDECHDGHRAWLAVDGKELATAALRERLLQQKGDMLEVGPADDALAGAVDELQVFAYAFTPAQVLPEGIEVSALRIAFDAQGEPIVPPEIKLEVVADHRTEVLHVGPGGVLQ